MKINLKQKPRAYNPYSSFASSPQSKAIQYMLMRCHCLKPEPWKRAHTELRCVRWVWNLIEETDRQYEAEPQGPEISLQTCRTGRKRCCCKLHCATVCNMCVCVCVCVCVEGLAVDGRCQTSQLHPHYGTTCWTKAIWRVGHLSGLILWGSDPACWPVIHDHTTWQETSHFWSCCLSVCFVFISVCCISLHLTVCFCSWIDGLRGTSGKTLSTWVRSSH